MDTKISLAEQFKRITENNIKNQEKDFEDIWKEEAESDYTRLSVLISLASGRGSYFLSFPPRIPYDAYYLLYEKLEKHGFKYEYTGNGYITVWWDDSDGKEYTHRFY